MGLGPRLDLRTTQSVVISPQLQAAIKLLTLSNLELMAEISAELDRNPLLEMADTLSADPIENPSEGRDPRNGAGDQTGDRADMVAGAATSGDEGAGDRGAADASGLDHDFQVRDGALGGGDQDVDYVEERFHHDSFADTPSAGSGEDFSFDQFAAQGPSLAEILSQQALALAVRDQPIALHLISLLDEAGYLTEPLEQIALQLGITFADAERVLNAIQTFEPTGVGARNLAECIALQAKEADRYDPCMAALIANLDLVAKGDLAQLRRLCCVDDEDLKDMLRELRSYDPKPGLIYGGGVTTPIVPDVFVKRTAKGWAVTLNNGTLPRLVVNRDYQARLSADISGKAPKVPKVGGKLSAQAKQNKQEQKFVDGCLAQASWLMRALDQRASTILRVASAIVEEQQGFFEKGVSHLKPMTLRQIADVVELHESTVSRVTSNKYLACDRGVFELKYFFTVAIQSAGGEDASAEAVRQKLKALIDHEPPLKPLSDDKLVELLKADGFDLARRTVAKYREGMGIPSSFDRRRRAIVKAG